LADGGGTLHGVGGISTLISWRETSAARLPIYRPDLDLAIRRMRFVAVSNAKSETFRLEDGSTVRQWWIRRGGRWGPEKYF